MKAERDSASKEREGGSSSNETGADTRNLCAPLQGKSPEVEKTQKSPGGETKKRRRRGQSICGGFLVLFTYFHFHGKSHFACKTQAITSA